MEEFSLNDIANDLLIINKQTIDILFSLDNGADCVALYVFYYKTSKWQKTSSIKATDEYVKKSLKWGIDRIKKAKGILKDNGLIKVTKRVDEKGIIVGWFVELSYMIENHIHNTQNPQVDESTSGFQETSAYNNINEMLNNDNINANKESIINNTKESSKRFKKPTLEELEAYINEKGYHFSASNFINYYDSVGWKIGKSPMKDWKAACRTWEAKYKNDNNGKCYKPKEISRETSYPEYDDVGYIR